MFEWKNFPRHTTLQLLQEIQRTMEKNKNQPEKLKDPIIFMSMYNDIDWEKEGNKEVRLAKSADVAAYARRFPEGHWSCLGPRTEEKWYGTHIRKPNVPWNNVADLMKIVFRERESGHPEQVHCSDEL